MFGMGKNCPFSIYVSFYHNFLMGNIGSGISCSKNKALWIYYVIGNIVVALLVEDHFSKVVV